MNTEPPGQGFIGPGVVGRDAAILDQSGNHLQPIDLGTSGQGLGQLQHVGGLAAGIWITTQFQLLSPKQPMEMQVEQIETHSYSIAMDGATIRYSKSGLGSPRGAYPHPPQRLHRPGRPGSAASPNGSGDGATTVKCPPAPPRAGGATTSAKPRRANRCRIGNTQRCCSFLLAYPPRLAALGQGCSKSNRQQGLSRQRRQ